MAPSLDATGFPDGVTRLPRDLHPGAWWLWAIGLAAAATFTTNPVALALILASVTVVVLGCRGDQPWSRSFRLYVWLGLWIVIVRVLFRLLFGGQPIGMPPTEVLLDLPRVPLPEFVRGITLLGPITGESLLFGFYDGLRLATLVICIGAANSLANPKRLLRSVPPALYEVGTALVVATTMLPQFADSVRRVRAAQSLRAGETRRVRGLRRIVVPVLEDAFERSMALAASMDSRGYGRVGEAGAARRRLTGALMMGGLLGLAVGVYATLDGTAPRWLATPMIVIGLVLAAGGLASAGRRVQRSIYRPDSWRVPEIGVAASGLASAVLAFWVSREQLQIAYPSLTAVPELSAVMLVAGLMGVVALLLAPPPVRTMT